MRIIIILVSMSLFSIISVAFECPILTLNNLEPLAQGKAILKVSTMLFERKYWKARRNFICAMSPDVLFGIHATSSASGRRSKVT